MRYRLNRGGDSQLNRAFHTVAMRRLAPGPPDPETPRPRDPETQAYAARTTEEGKTPREIKRCLKRHRTGASGRLDCRAAAYVFERRRSWVRPLDS